MRQWRALYRGAALRSRARSWAANSHGQPRRNRARARQRRRLGVGGHGRAEVRSSSVSIQVDALRIPIPEGEASTMRSALSPGQSSRGAARGRCENRAGGAARTQASSGIRTYRIAPMWASCRFSDRNHIQLRVFERGAGETRPAARAPARRSRSAVRQGLLDGGSAGGFAGRHGDGLLGGSGPAHLADWTRYHGLLRVRSI